MDDGSRLSGFVHRHFLWLLLGAYALAALVPGPGLALRDVSLAHMTLPMLLLAFLLWNAGLGVDIHQLGQLLHHPLVLLTGLVANLLVPLLFLFIAAHGLACWHNPDEAQNILVGLALVAAMPIAGSSTAWSRKANGNMVLSLGLVLLSTLFSPMTALLTLNWAGWLTTGDYADELRGLAGSGAGGFLGVCVVAPSLLGMLTRAVLRTRGSPSLKLSNSLVLLLLIYSNAAAALPQAVLQPDLDFLALMFAIVVALCLVAFTSGWLLARLLRTDAGQLAALMFGLGMNNNGTGLVLGSVALGGHPTVLLPVILYNLVQHVVAGMVDFLLARQTRVTLDKPSKPEV